MLSPPQYGPHATLKKNEHNVTEEQIANAWVFGELEPSDAQPGCWRLIGDEITLVLSPNGTFIITMYPNKHNDKDTAERVGHAMSVGATRWEESL